MSKHLYFCKNCSNKISEDDKICPHCNGDLSKTGRFISISVFDSAKAQDTLESKAFGKGSKKFFAHIISGWFPSKRNDLSPEGINKERIINRRENHYKEKITDVKTGRIIRYVDEKLTEHRN